MRDARDWSALPRPGTVIAVMSQRMKTTVIAILALLLVFSLVIPAFAHAQLLSSQPANGDSLATTDEVVLTFNEEISPDFVQIAATGPDGDILDGEAVVDGAVLTQPIRPTSNGEHTVTYRVVSADGHPVSGEVTFTLTDADTDADTDTDARDTDARATESAATESAAVTATAASATPDPAANPAPEEQELSADGFGLALPLALGIVLITGIGGTVAWMAWKRRHDH